MKKLFSIALAATLASFAIVPFAVHAEGAAPASASVGKSIYGANGNRVASIYRVTQAGAVQVIIDGKLVTVPNSTLSEANGKLVTTLTKFELLRVR
jgi:hypothetical protein